MTEESHKNYRYQVGGALSNEELSYVTREADRIFYEDLPQNKDWRKADKITWKAMLSSAYSKNIDLLSYSNISCSHLKTIDDLWTKHSKGKYGFSVQKEIWEKLGSPTYDNSPIEMWREFYLMVGWKTEESGTESSKGYLNENELGAFKDYKRSTKGNLPLGIGGRVGGKEGNVIRFFSYAKVCNL